MVPYGAFEGVKFQAVIRGAVTLPAATTRADAGPDQIDARAGTPITLSGTCTETSPGAIITDCSWNGPGLTNAPNPAGFTPASDGTFTFTLTATSTAGTDSDNMTVFVSPVVAPIQTSTSGCSLGQGGSDYSWLLTLGFLALLRKKILV